MRNTGRAGRRCWMGHGALMLVLAAMAAPAAGQTIYGDFDWRNNNGNWVTPIRSQGGCGSCWAFGATAALESQFLINDGTPGIDLNLSEQHLLCDGGAGSCSGGWEFQANNFFVSDGITDEATLPYRASNTSPLWPLSEPYTLYKTDEVRNFFPGDDSTAGIKQWLEDTGPLPTFMDANDFFSPPGGIEAAMEFSIPTEYAAGAGALAGTPGDMDPASASWHCVAVVGYKDDASLTSGGYWIVKNSWGSWWGDAGYGFIEYGDLERHSRTHAIIGDTFTVVVGGDGGIEVTGVAGDGSVTFEDNPTPEHLDMETTLNSLSFFDVEVLVTGQQTEITVDADALNNGDRQWDGFGYQLGHGVGDAFTLSDDSDGLSFASASSAALPTVENEGDTVWFGPATGGRMEFADGGVLPGAVADFLMGINLPGTESFRFTLRQFGASSVPEPSALVLAMVGLVAVVVVRRRR